MNKTRSVLVVLVGVAIMVATESRAALSPLGGEFPLLGDISGHQQNPNVTLSQSGGFVVWQNMAANSKSERVMVQRLGSDMTGVGVPTRVSQGNSEGNELHPRIAMLSGGGAVAVWESGPRADTDVFVRILNVSGSYITGALPVNTYTTGKQQHADVAVLTDGNVIVVWSSEGQDGDGNGIYGQLFTSGGARIGGEFRVNKSTSMNQSDPVVTAMSDGKFAVAWVSESVSGRTQAGAPNLRGNVMGRVFVGYGRAVGNEYRLSDNSALASAPVLASGDDGGFLAAWTQRDEENTRNMNDVYIRSFDNSGAPSGKSEKHNTHLAGQQLKPELIQLAGDALVAWTTYGQDASGAGIQGRLASGGIEFQVNSQGQLHQKSPAVATDGASKFLVVWVNTIKPSHSILSAQRYVTSDSALDGVVDVTDGAVEVVAADSGSRLTGTASAAPAASTVQINVPAPAAPSMAAAPPTSTVAVTRSASTSSVAAPSTPAPQAQAPSPARASAPRSLASARAGRSTAVSRRMPKQNSFAQQRSAMAGFSMMQRMAKNRSLGRPSSSSTGRATNMARAPQSRDGQFGGQGRSLPGRGTPPRMNSSRDSQTRSGSLANARANTSRRTASGMVRGLNRSGNGSPGARGSNPAQSRTIQASLQRGDEGRYNLSWQSQSGRRYVVQGSNDLRSWKNIGTARSGRGGPDSVRVGGTNAPRYYRIQQAN